MSLKAQIWSGTGNSFIICSLLGKTASEVSQLESHCPDLAIELCDAHKVDGFLTLKKSETADLVWDFYNNDGSRAEMCGNAARCVASFAKENQLFTSSFTLETLSGLIGCTPLNESAKVEMSLLEEVSLGHIESVGGVDIKGDLIDSGVPHFVIDVDQNNLNLEDEKALTNICKSLREAHRFPPRGANITFLKYIEANEIDSISFERGVENFTLACGTGSVAAAHIAHKKLKKNRIIVNVPGGILEIDFSKRLPVLCGPTTKHKEIEIGY